MTDWEIWIAAIAAAVLAKFAFNAAIPSVELPPQWSKKARWGVQGATIALLSFIGHEVGPSMFHAVSGALTVSRDTGEKYQDQADETHRYLEQL